MALKGLTDKSETIKHAVAKFLLFIILRRKGYKAAVEFNTGGNAIYDCVDFTNGYAFDIMSKMNKKVLAEKVKKYTLYAGIKDVIFVDLNDYDLKEPVEVWLERLEKKTI